MIDVSPIERHERIALSFSGGKDSLACAYLLRPYMSRITLYHLDTGDLLPETRDIVRQVREWWPHFVHVQGDIDAFTAGHGLPTDLLPYGSHPVGRQMGQERVGLISRYDCCFANLMLPMHRRIKADGNTLVVRGTKIADMDRLPAVSGDTFDGVELWLPLRDWSHEQVFDYLRSVGAPISRVYDHVTNSPECARCSAWWNEERAAYLRKFHPALFADYAARLRKVAAEIDGPVRNLARELRACGAVQ